ncbi:MAG: hypothetical protein WD078_15690 [Woeseia sp.]
MSEMKRIKIEESESKAKQLLAAVRRLERKFPELTELPSGASAVRQRFEALCKPVKLENLDPRGSLIGGIPFLSPKYPEPESDEASVEGRQYSVGMAPLAQLDLDQKYRHQHLLIRPSLGAYRLAPQVTLGSCAL